MLTGTFHDAGFIFTLSIYTKAAALSAVSAAAKNNHASISTLLAELTGPRFDSELEEASKDPNSNAANRITRLITSGLSIVRCACIAASAPTPNLPQLAFPRKN